MSASRDCQLVILSPQRGRFDLPWVREFECEYEAPGWSGFFKLDDESHRDNEFKADIKKDRAPSEMYQYVAETDGSTTTYKFNDVSFTTGSDLVLFHAKGRMRI